MKKLNFKSIENFYQREPEIWQLVAVQEALDKLHHRHEDRILNAATIRREVVDGTRQSDENVEVTMYAWLRRFEHYSPRYFMLDDASIGEINGRIILDLFDQIAYFEPILSVNAFITHYKKIHGDCEPIRVFTFEGNRAEHLIQLVREGKKTSIATPLLLEDADHFNYKTGDLVLVAYPDHNAAAIVRITQSKIAKFKDITRRFAYLAGEGDLSLEFFKTSRFIAFNRIYKAKGLVFDENEAVDLKTFKLVATASDLLF